MITIKNFLKVKDDFIDIKDFKGTIDEDIYIEGAIIININDVEVMGLAHYDYILILWNSLVNQINETKLKSATAINFPDQPTTLLIEPNGQDLIKLSMDSKFLSSCNRDEFIQELKASGINFYLKMKTINPNLKTEIEEMLNIIASF